MMVPARIRLAPLAIALALSLTPACGGMAGVRVARRGPVAEPRPPGCALEVLEKAPDRPHEELAELTATAPSADGQAALAVLREPACRLGADALVVTHRTTPRGAQSMVSAVAIRWLPGPQAGEEPPGARSL